MADADPPVQRARPRRRRKVLPVPDGAASVLQGGGGWGAIKRGWPGDRRAVDATMANAQLVAENILTGRTRPLT
jgi:hypothetical protein